MVKTKITRNVTLSAALSLTMLSGCAGGSSGAAPGADPGDHAKKSDKPAELVFYSSNGDPAESFNYRFGDSLRKKFPNYTFKYIQSAKGSTLPELITAGTKFDIFFISTGNYEQMMLDNNLQIDMDPLAKKHNVDLSRLEPTVVESIRQSSGGKLYGIPVHTNNMVLYYNKAIFDKFGVPYPKDGMTWDETLATAKKLTMIDNGVQYMGFSTSPNHILRMNQLSIPNADLATNAPTINKDERWKTFFQTVFQEPYQDLGYQKRIAEMKKIADFNVFMKDQTLAMYAYLSSLVYVLPEDLKKMNWDMVTLPTFKDKPGIGSQSYPFYFGITRLSQNQDEAMEVLKYMISDEFQTELAKKGIMPVLKNESVQKQLGQDSPFKDKNFKAVFLNKFAPIPPKAPYDATLVTNYAKYADQLMKQGADINTALRKAEEDSVKTIETYIKSK
ncbi:ABC transporter substrate-binding protein [Paenibacillus allorhizosphaerae]|uniref:Extracellular solute-binding protein n=1 Tax=Paenibacillus allorhizosphaerae TaxID=2849866 RepID=A0ABM8VB75_9BACL|nr:extracellular solute-binding protein [Paenibacillus allorhizosphaerae]CAG7618698.1 hypothetical protein PAECIP111802_00543 [Paenibacillus allorhizosphaerae]